MTLYQPPPFEQGEWNEYNLSSCGNSYGIGVNAEVYLSMRPSSVPSLVGELVELLQRHQNPDGLVGVRNFIEYCSNSYDSDYGVRVDLANLLQGKDEDGLFSNEDGSSPMIIQPRKPEYRHLF